MKRELLLVGAFVLLSSLPFLDKAFHVDEPLYLPAARHILSDPLHPLAFELNYYGRSLPYAEINNTPPLIMYLLAAALKLTGGREWAMRLFFLPFDLAAAAGLYLLAARFLARPLLPVLIVIACPAWWLNMGNLMPEKLVLAFGLCGLYGFVRWAQGGRASWFWWSAGLMALAVLSKYNSVVLILAGAGYAVSLRLSWGRIIGWASLGLAGLAVYLGYDALASGAAPGAAWKVTRQAMDLPTSGWAHKLRSIPAFLGGGAVAAAVWPFLAWRPGRGAGSVLLLGTSVLFLPFLDIGPVRLVDRLTGILLSAGSFWLVWVLYGAAPRARGGRAARPRSARPPAGSLDCPGWPLWASWFAAGLFFAAIYWSVMARTVLLMVPPAVFGLAALLEKRWSAAAFRRLCLASLAGTFLLGASLSLVDHRYAASQKAVADEVESTHLSRGRRVWCSAHWGLQWYLESAGARMLDLSRGGWDEVRPGDVVVVPRVNTNIIRPHGPVLANVTRRPVRSAVPLRLMCSGACEGGFYSNVMGFLPFSLSLEPLDVHELIEVL